MTTAWSIGHGRRSKTNMRIEVDISYLAKTHSPGPAAYCPIARSKTPNPKWRYILKLWHISMGGVKKTSIYPVNNTPGPGTYSCIQKV